MKLQLKHLVLLVLVVLSLSGCSAEGTDITMPYSSDQYATDGWTKDDLVAHFKELGFTNIETRKVDIDSYEPDEISMVDVDAFMSEKLTGFNKGESFSPSEKIEITYFDFNDILTVENCEDLAKVVGGEEIDYELFARKYDKKLVKFDAHIVYLSYYMNSATSCVLDVCGGDNNSDTKGVVEFNIDFDTVDMADKFYDGFKQGGYSEGCNVTVVGKIDHSQSEYLKKIALRVSLFDVEGNGEISDESSAGNDSSEDGSSATRNPVSSGNSPGDEAKVTVPVKSESEGNLVWVPTNGGKKYHCQSGCSNMEDPIQVSIETAEDNGYTPCKRCY